MQFCRKLDITGSGISGDNTNFINFEFMGGCFATEWDETEMRISDQPLICSLPLPDVIGVLFKNTFAKFGNAVNKLSVRSRVTVFRIKSL